MIPYPQNTKCLCILLHMSLTVAYIDGSSRSNSGSSGIGVIIQHATGRRVEITEWVASSDNNYAEYAALLAALEYATACGCPRLHVFSDSEVVVKQITGQYSCQSRALRQIYESCKTAIRSLEHFAITHIRRENNADANRLANTAVIRRSKNFEKVFVSS
jgi:ribonuclease HI